MLAAGLIVLLAAGLAAFTYLRLERLGTKAWVPMVARAIAWSAIGLLLLNVGCPVAGRPQRPLVLLDGSISMAAPGGRWTEARDSARRLGDVALFGDEGTTTDTTPSRGRSLLRPALTAAAASDRPVIVVTDGELEDARDLPPELLGRATVRTMARQPRPDVALTAVAGPARVTAGDSIVLQVEARAVAGAAPESLFVEVLSGSKPVVRRRLRSVKGATAKIQVALSSSSIGAGDHVLTIRLAGAEDEEPRTDTRLHLVSVAPTPGVVLLAAPGDWDSRFLYAALRDVARPRLRPARRRPLALDERPLRGRGRPGAPGRARGGSPDPEG
jgi:hypothetical protein